MRRYMLVGSLLAAVVVAVITTTAKLQGHKPTVPPSNEQAQADKSNWPVTDFEAPEPSEAQEHAVRRLRSEKYNKSKLEVNPLDVSENSFLTHSETDDLPSLPVRQSDVIVLGQVVDAHAHLSSDKTGVYSEFTMRADDVLKNDAPLSVTQGSSIAVQREGGRVRFPSGRVHLYSISSERMPGVGGRYVLFLKRLERGQAFILLTGYALRGGQISPLDGNKQFEVYKGIGEAAFIDEIKRAATASSQTMPD